MRTTTALVAFAMMLIALVLASSSSLTDAANHCVRMPDPYGGPQKICDYGCIHAPCYICIEMCEADGGVLDSCTGPCTGSGGTCKKEINSGNFKSKSMGARLYRAHLLNNTKKQ